MWVYNYIFFITTTLTTIPLGNNTSHRAGNIHFSLPLSACCVVARAILLDYVVCVVVNFVYFTIPFSTLRSRREAKGEEHPTKSRTLPGTPLRRKVVVTSLRVGLVINIIISAQSYNFFLTSANIFDILGKKGCFYCRF